MDKRVPLSVVVITKNEESKIAQCLESVKWADEIVIVDDESSDKTIEIAKRYTQRILIRRMDVEGIHRNWAYAQAKNSWVLSLDADERATLELPDEISRAISTNKFAAFSIPLRNYIGDYWVRYGGWYPASKVRLFRKDKFRYEEVSVHPRVFIEGECGHLKSDIIHYSYRNFEDFIAKLNRQTTWEAQKWFDQDKPMRLGRFIWRTLDRFMRTYVGKKGYKEGFIGFMVAYLAALYQFMSYLKYRELILRKRGLI